MSRSEAKARAEEQDRLFAGAELSAAHHGARSSDISASLAQEDTSRRHRTFQHACYQERRIGSDGRWVRAVPGRIRALGFAFYDHGSRRDAFAEWADDIIIGLVKERGRIMPESSAAAMEAARPLW